MTFWYPEHTETHTWRCSPEPIKLFQRKIYAYCIMFFKGMKKSKVAPLRLLNFKKMSHCIFFFLYRLLAKTNSQWCTASAVEPHPLPACRGSGCASMSSHPQSVPSVRRTVDTRHLPNPATLPLQLQRAHTVRKLAHPVLNFTCGVSTFLRIHWRRSSVLLLGGYLVSSALLWSTGEGLNPGAPTGVFPNRSIHRLQCCAHRPVPSLDVWVESSCWHSAATLRPSPLF